MLEEQVTTPSHQENVMTEGEKAKLLANQGAKEVATDLEETDEDFDSKAEIAKETGILNA